MGTLNYLEKHYFIIFTILDWIYISAEPEGTRVLKFASLRVADDALCDKTFGFDFPSTLLCATDNTGDVTKSPCKVVIWSIWVQHILQ